MNTCTEITWFYNKFLSKRHLWANLELFFLLLFVSRVLSIVIRNSPQTALPYSMNLILEVLNCIRFFWIVLYIFLMFVLHAKLNYYFRFYTILIQPEFLYNNCLILCFIQSKRHLWANFWTISFYFSKILSMWDEI